MTKDFSSKKAGASARAEHERRLKAREKRINENFPRIGKYLLKIFSPQASIKAWEKGAIGEEKIGKLLDEIAAENDYKVLHDLIIPNSKSNIDHIMVTEFGVFVFDSKNYSGKVEVRNLGNFLKGFEEVLYIGNRRQTVLIEKMNKQVTIVKKILDPSVPVFAILAFYKAEFPLLFKPTKIKDVYINSKGVRKILGDFPRTQIVNVSRTTKVLLDFFD